MRDSDKIYIFLLRKLFENLFSRFDFIFLFPMMLMSVSCVLRIYRYILKIVKNIFFFIDEARAKK